MQICITTFGALCAYDVMVCLRECGSAPSSTAAARQAATGKCQGMKCRRFMYVLLACAQTQPCQWSSSFLVPPTIRRVLGAWGVMGVSGVSFLVARLQVHGNVTVKPWTAQENQFVHMKPVSMSWRQRGVYQLFAPRPSPLAYVLRYKDDTACCVLRGQGLLRTLSILNTHARYVLIMVWPHPLSFEWGLGSHQLVGAVVSYTAAKTLVVLLAVLWLTITMARRRMWCGLWGLAWAVLSWLPSSNVLVFVGTEFAERLMYLPRCVCASVCLASVSLF